MDRFWCFTWNNYDGIVVPEDFGKWFRYVIYQEEVGENGTPHLQGYIEFKRQMRLSALKKMLPTAHWEPRRGTQEEAITYCTKVETRVAGPYEMGTKTKGQGERTDIRTAYEALRAGSSMASILDTHTEVFFKYQRGLMAAKLVLDKPRDSTRPKDVYYLYGPPGVGKSRMASEMAPTAFRKSPNSKWFDGYDGELDLILDDLTSGWFTWSSLMQILDRYGTQVETKGGSRQLLCDRVIITSNKRPWDLYQSKDGVTKHPIAALLRRISHYLEFSDDGSHVDHGSLDPNSSSTLNSLLNL